MFGHFLRFSLGASLHFFSAAAFYECACCCCFCCTEYFCLVHRCYVCTIVWLFRLFVGLSCLKYQDDSCIVATKRLTLYFFLILFHISTRKSAHFSTLNHKEGDTSERKREREKNLPETVNCEWIAISCETYIIPLQNLNRIGHNFIGAYCVERERHKNRFWK